MRIRHRQALLGLVFGLTGLFAVPAAWADGEKFELVGKITDSAGMPFRRRSPVIYLHSALSPFTARTVADRGGDFKLKNLPRGTYTLTVLVPRVGERTRTIELGPSFADAHGRVRVTVAVDRNAAPAAHAVSARQLSVPGEALELYRKAEGELSDNRVDEAVRCLKKALEIAPQFAAAWNHLGTISYHRRNLDEAEEYFRKCLAQEAEFYPALVNLGGTLLSGGKFAESLSVNLRAVERMPNDPLARSQLGQSYFHLGQFEPAVLHLNKAKELDPSHFSFPQLVLAEIYLSRDDLPSTIRELEEFLHLHPDSPMAPKLRLTLDQQRSKLDRRP